MEDTTEQKYMIGNWRIILAGLLYFVGCTSLLVGIASGLFGPSQFFHINEQRQQSEVLDRIRQHVINASSSYDIAVAEQQLTEAVTEIEGYLKAQPLAEISGTDFENWYRSIPGVKHQLNLAEQVENSNASPFQKLQADKMALDSLREFAKAKSTIIFGIELGVEYNIPSSIPLKLNSLETAFTALYWLLFPIGIASIVLALILVAVIEKSHEFFDS